MFEKEPDGSLKYYHLLGPMISEEISSATITAQIHKHNIPLQYRYDLLKFLQSLPVIPPTRLFSFLVMLHYCATGEALMRSDIRFQQSLPLTPHTPASEKDRHKTYMAEQALFQMVREGNLSYKKALGDANTISNGIRITLGDSLKNAKVNGIIFTTLCVRAAIEGGLTPEMAYSLGDAYIQSMMDCQNYSEAININHTMYDDFIRRVHKCRTDAGLSRPIQICCDYINLHVEEKLQIAALAQYVGYTEYYLSRKFKAETGSTLNDYIKTAKVKRAQTLLTCTADSISDISEQLNFSSRNYFSGAFKQVTGLSPAQYRQKNRR